MTFMDATQILTGLAIGSAIGGVIGFILANTAARARTAGVDAIRLECETLRIENKLVRDEASKSKGLLEASQQSVRALQEEIKIEREKVTTATATASESDKELSRINALFKEKCASLVELRNTVEQSREALTDVFKATGADVLKATTETFMAQAKQQFESQSQLSQQDLESRQKAFDATLTPFKDQIVKQEKLINDLDQNGQLTLPHSQNNSNRLQVYKLQLQVLRNFSRVQCATIDNAENGVKLNLEISLSWPECDHISITTNKHPLKEKKDVFAQI